MSDDRKDVVRTFTNTLYPPCASSRLRFEDWHAVS